MGNLFISINETEIYNQLDQHLPQKDTQNLYKPLVESITSPKKLELYKKYLEITEPLRDYQEYMATYLEITTLERLWLENRHDFLSRNERDNSDITHLAEKIANLRRREAKINTTIFNLPTNSLLRSYVDDRFQGTTGHFSITFEGRELYEEEQERLRAKYFQKIDSDFNNSGGKLYNEVKFDEPVIIDAPHGKLALAIDIGLPKLRSDGSEYELTQQDQIGYLINPRNGELLITLSDGFEANGHLAANNTNQIIIVNKEKSVNEPFSTSYKTSNLEFCHYRSYYGGSVCNRAILVTDSQLETSGAGDVPFLIIRHGKVIYTSPSDGFLSKVANSFGHKFTNTHDEIITLLQGDIVLGMSDGVEEQFLPSGFSNINENSRIFDIAQEYTDAHQRIADMIDPTDIASSVKEIGKQSLASMKIDGKRDNLTLFIYQHHG